MDLSCYTVPLPDLASQLILSSLRSEVVPAQLYFSYAHQRTRLFMADLEQRLLGFPLFRMPVSFGAAAAVQAYNLSVLITSGFGAVHYSYDVKKSSPGAQ